MVLNVEKRKSTVNLSEIKLILFLRVIKEQR